MLSLQLLIALSASLTISGARAEYKQAYEACVTLSRILPEQVSFPQSQGYEESISSYAYIGTRLRPACIVSPKTTRDVVATIRTLGTFESVPFAIRSGGHNTNIGFANVQNGVTMDLSQMNSVTFENPAKTVSVGPGARWQSVYDTLDPYGLSVQGGRNGRVGVGGFLTGGGIGFFSPQRGWACDSVANFEVVLSSGLVVNANATSHADLFTALKGGSNNFGVVTRLDLEVFVQGPMWGGVILYSNSTDQELLAALTAFKKPENFDPYAMFTFGFLYDAAKRAFTADIAMYSSRPETVPGSALETFAKIQPQIYSSLRLGSPGSFAGESLGPVSRPFYMDWATTTFVVNPHTLSQVRAAFERTSIALTERYASANLTIACSIQSVPAAAPLTNPNILGFDPNSHPEMNLMNIGIAFQYEDAAAAYDLRRATKDFAIEIDRIAALDHAKDRHLYLNYAGSWQNVFGGYGMENLEKMRAVSKIYDRKGMFQNQVRGGFKLGPTSQ